MYLFCYIFVFFFRTLFLCLIFQSTFCIFSIILKSCFLYYFLFVFILFLVITITIVTIVCASFLFSVSSLSFLTFSSYCQNYRLNDEVSCNVVINHQKKNQLVTRQHTIRVSKPRCDQSASEKGLYASIHSNLNFTPFLWWNIFKYHLSKIYKNVEVLYTMKRKIFLCLCICFNLIHASA